MTKGAEIFIYDAEVHGLEYVSPRLDQPERLLLMALITNAIETLAAKKPRWKTKFLSQAAHQQRVREADKAAVLQWLDGTEHQDTDRGFTFEQVCAHLGLDPAQTKEKILRRARSGARLRWRSADSPEQRYVS